MKQYIITTRFDDVFTLFLFCFCFSLVSLHGDECKCIVQRRASPRDILRLTQAPIFVWFGGNIILLLPFQLYSTVSSVLLCLVAMHGD